MRVETPSFSVFNVALNQYELDVVFQSRKFLTQNFPAILSLLKADTENAVDI